MTELEFFLLVLSASAILVGVVRRFAISQGVLDHPTERGSHDTPTPRGGGLGVVAVILTAFIFIALGARDVRIWTSIVACGAVALVGWQDDRRGLAVGTRLGVHLLAGLALGIFAVAPGMSFTLQLGVFAVWALWTVTSINFVNFMDGINGFVACQIAIFAMSLVFFGSAVSRASWYAAAVAAACIGFLPWNFPRARIFLGDVGSGALGFLVPFVALMTMREQSISAGRVFLPLFPLFGDAIVTLLRRWLRGEKVTQAHRSHLYQRVANGGAGHTKVTLLFAAASLVGAVLSHAGDLANGWTLPATFAVVLLVIGALIERRVKIDPASRMDSRE